MLSHLCVRKNHQNRGVANTLVQKVIDFAWKKNCQKIELTTLIDMSSARYDIIKFLSSIKLITNNIIIILDIFTLQMVLEK